MYKKIGKRIVRGNELFVILYHYVPNHRTAQMIVEDQRLKASVPLYGTPVDELDYPSVYFTDVAPEKGKLEVSRATGLDARWDVRYGLELLVSDSVLSIYERSSLLPDSIRVRPVNGEDGIDVRVLRVWSMDRVERRRERGDDPIARSETSLVAFYN